MTNNKENIHEITNNSKKWIHACELVNARHDVFKWSISPSTTQFNQNYVIFPFFVLNGRLSVITHVI